MESSSTIRKEKKGLSRLWTKVRLALKSKSKASSAATTTDPSNVPITQSPTVQSNNSGTPVTTQDLHNQASTTTRLNTQNSIKPYIEMASAPVSTAHTSADVGGPLLPGQISNKAGHEPVLEADSPNDEKGEHNRRYERAQAIFRKYNLDINEVDWESRPAAQGERVYKTPRMRVRWTCHECKTTFGHDKICVECAHQRCRQCARYPPKKKKSRALKKAAVTAAASEAAGPSDAPGEEVQEGTCHECQTTFDLGSTECSNCHHHICERCLKETVASAEQAEAHAVSTN